jgi:predicted transcriptional regulator
MFIPCEAMIKQLLPAIRAGVTKELARKYNFNQVEIASELGVTQAAVSNYLSGKYAQEIKEVENKKAVKENSKKIAHLIANGKPNKKQIVEAVCLSCKEVLESECKI